MAVYHYHLLFPFLNDSNIIAPTLNSALRHSYRRVAAAEKCQKTTQTHHIALSLSLYLPLVQTNERRNEPRTRKTQNRINKNVRLRSRRSHGAEAMEKMCKRAKTTLYYLYLQFEIRFVFLFSFLVAEVRWFTVSVSLSFLFFVCSKNTKNYKFRL